MVGVDETTVLRKERGTRQYIDERDRMLPRREREKKRKKETERGSERSEGAREEK
jgi:hypothetical protein